MTELDVVEGMQFDRGYLSPYFVTDPSAWKRARVAVILIHEKKISNMKDLLPLLEQVARAGKPLLIIAGGQSKARRSRRSSSTSCAARSTCAAVKAPGFGDRRKAMLQDIAVLTGGQAIIGGARSQARERDHQGPRPGQARVDRQGQHDDRRRRRREEGDRGPLSRQIRSQVEVTTSDYDREKLQERLAKLVGGVAVVKVGAATETEMKEKKARVEDALHATRRPSKRASCPAAAWR